MQKSWLFLAVLFAALLAHADPVDVVFLAFNGGHWQWGYPYSAFVQGVGDIPVMCDDYAHGGLPGNMWLANPTDLGTGNLNLLRFNDLPGALTLYDEAGWLLLETQTTPRSAWRDMNVAVWHIFDPQAPLTPFASWWLMEAQKEAATGFPGVNFNDVEILTPLDQHSTDPNGPQELMYLTSSSPAGPGATPEPGTVLLLATGLGAVLWRKWIAGGSERLQRVLGFEGLPGLDCEGFRVFNGRVRDMQKPKRTDASGPVMGLHSSLNCV